MCTCTSTHAETIQLDDTSSLGNEKANLLLKLFPLSLHNTCISDPSHALWSTKIIVHHHRLRTVYVAMTKVTNRFKVPFLVLQEIVYHDVVRLLLRRKWKKFARYHYMWVSVCRYMYCSASFCIAKCNNIVHVCTTWRSHILKFFPDGLHCSHLWRIPV